MCSARDHYERQYADSQYANPGTDTPFRAHERAREFAREHSLGNGRLLEVGCGRGVLQDIVNNYVGIDISITAGRYVTKPFCVASAANPPFPDCSFDSCVSVHALEHIAGPDDALNEMRRILRDGGKLMLEPAWFCRPWAADGYSVRPFSDFGIRGKLTKALIPVRNSLAYRAAYVFPVRFVRLLVWRILKQPMTLHYGKLNPNYDRFWTSDSDAINSIDPFEIILWFLSRGDQCLSRPTLVSQFFVRTGGIVLQIHK